MDTPPLAADDPLRTPPCPDCSGLGTKLLQCSCTATGEPLISDYSTEPGNAMPLPDCKRCQGSGTLSVPCSTCAGAGAARAQVVVTVINIDTGAIASETILPGVLSPQWIQSELGDEHRWALPLSPVVDRLVATAGGTLIESHENTTSLSWSLAVPGDWSADLPTDTRLALEAQAIARAQARTRHRHFFTTSAVVDAVDPDARFAHLAAIADRLHLDLCCYRYATVSDELDRPTQRGWSVTFELPHSEKPSPRTTRVDHPSLADALTASAPLELLKRVQLQQNMREPRPARFIRDTATPTQAAPVGLTVDAITEQLATLTGALDGAVAVRRDGVWHFAKLEPASALDDFQELDTGQVRHRRIRTWRRTPAPPVPAWWGDPIPERACPNCETGTTWVACECFQTLTDAPDPHCERCAGTGTREGTHCSRCCQVGRIRYGYTVTIANLHGASAHHYNVNPGVDPEHRPAAWPAIPELTHHQLPDTARLTHRLFADGIDLADLRELTGLRPSAGLLDGGVIAPVTRSMTDLVYQHVVHTTGGRPGARIILTWTPPPPATVLQAARIAWGLGFDLVVGAEDRNADALAGTTLGGMRWGARLLRPNAEPDRDLTGTFGKRRLAIAVQDLIDDLPHRLNVDTQAKPKPLEVVAAPQQPHPPLIPGAERLEAVLSRIASLHGGLHAHTIVARLSPHQATFLRLTAGTERRLQPVVPMAEAPTLAEALAILGRHEGP
jgi:hypothetical protein